MVLRALELKAVYSTERDDLLRDFYIPALLRSTAYDRAVGFFSAQMLSLAAQGVSALLEKNGLIRLVVGAALRPEEEHAIREGYLQKEVYERIGREFCVVMENIADGLTRNRLETLSWLVAGGKLQIRVAVRRRGMFHDKVGVLTDENGDMLVFQGSANETPHALLPDFNFESISVFQSWRPELRDHFDAHKGTFDRLWANRVRDTLVVEFPKLGTDKLLQLRHGTMYPRTNVELAIWDETNRGEDEEIDRDRPGPSVPAVIGDRPFAIQAHQREALRVWKAHDFCGILEHATGSGKTVAAIYGATKLYESVGRMFLVVAVPYQNLADQWVTQLRAFGWRAVHCYVSTSKWQSELREEVSLFDAGITDVGCAVVVSRTLGSGLFGSILGGLRQGHFMFVGDECHHYGSERLASALPESAKYRLGLSATPFSGSFDDKDVRIRSYFGSVVDRFPLSKALEEGVLTPYRYEVVFCELDHVECEEYLELSARIARFIGGGFSDEDDRMATLLSQRARVLAHCGDKLEKLRALVRRETVESLSLFYCGDGAVEGDEPGCSLRHVEAVATVLDEEGWKSSIFTAEEGLDERRRILRNFETRLVDAIVAIRCLDEGIDVPACRSAFLLASSRNSRQFVQRRGRILRRAPGKTMARVVDFVVKMADGGYGREGEAARRLFRGELRRVVEFATTACNFGQVWETIKDVVEEYDLSHEVISGMTVSKE